MSNDFVAYEGTEPYVFVSYAHKDKDIVEPLIRGLRDRGVRVWYDGGLELTEEWLDCIANHLDQSTCVLTFVSRKFEASANCRQEIGFAIEEGKGIAVIYLEPRENLKPRTRMQLGPLHAMFYYNYSGADAFLDELMGYSVLQSCIGEAAKADSVEAAPVPFATIVFDGEEKAATAETPEDWYQKAKKLYEQKEYEEAVVWFRKAAEQGHARAQCHFGVCYELGNGIAQDYAEAVKWYRASAEQNLAWAQCNLAVCCEFGNGIAKDYAEAVKWYRAAAEQGSARAQNNLGGCYAGGRGVSQDRDEAVKWYRKAAEQGYAIAQYNMGLCYANGRGVPQDHVEAAKWYRKAAEQGNVKAQFNLAYCYAYGDGVKQDQAEAAKWYREAAEQGHTKAQYMMGDCCENGKGIEKDLQQAIAWYQKVADKADPNWSGKARDAIKRCEMAQGQNWWTV